MKDGILLKYICIVKRQCDIVMTVTAIIIGNARMALRDMCTYPYSRDLYVMRWKASITQKSEFQQVYQIKH